MNKTLIILVILITIAGIFTSASFADSPRDDRGMGEHLPIGKLLNNPQFAEELELNSDQITALKTLHFDHQKKMISLRSSLQLKKLELKQLMDAEQLDRDLIKKKVKEISLVKGDLALEKVDMKVSAAEILTKDQLAKLKKMRGQVREKRMIKRMEFCEPVERIEKKMRMHRHHPDRQDFPYEEEVERRIIIEEEEE